MSRVLVVDDSMLSRQTLSDMLTGKGHEVLFAANGREALTVAKAAAPDCMLLDLLMPELDGFGVLVELKKDGVSLPVVVITADIQDTTRDKCMALGAKTFLNKPVSESGLDQALAEVL